MLSLKAARNRLNKINNIVMDFLAVDTCPLTGDPIAPDELFSAEGRDILNSISPDYHLPMDRIIDRFGSDEVAITMIYGLCSTQKSPKSLDIVHRIKYEGRKSLGRQMGKLLAHHIREIEQQILAKTPESHADISHLPTPVNYDLLLPVPLHPVKRKERGFNQSLAIAKGMASITNTPIDTTIIKRIKYSLSQTRLDSKERSRGMELMFQLYPDRPDITGKSILIVDDVLTTGSTANTVAKHLLEAGARRVDVACLAVSELNINLSDQKNILNKGI